jgi:hypothetical protein
VYVSPNHPDYERLKGAGPGGAASGGPAPSGELLAAFPRKGPRGLELELRVILDAFEGHPYLALRLWQRDRAGAWWPLKGRGRSIRSAEAQGVAEALLEARDRVDPRTGAR